MIWLNWARVRQTWFVQNNNLCWKIMILWFIPIMTEPCSWKGQTMKRESIETVTAAQESEGLSTPLTYVTSNQSFPNEFERLCVRSSMDFAGSKCSGNRSFKCVTFESELRVRGTRGFVEWKSLCRIDIPPSVEIITFTAFSKCTSLTDNWIYSFKPRKKATSSGWSRCVVCSGNPSAMIMCPVNYDGWNGP
jgi:hypothetical protein